MYVCMYVEICYVNNVWVLALQMTLLRAIVLAAHSVPIPSYGQPICTIQHTI